MENDIFDRSLYFDASVSADENLRGDDAKRKSARNGRSNPSPTVPISIDEDTIATFQRRIAEAKQRGL